MASWYRGLQSTQQERRGGITQSTAAGLYKGGYEVKENLQTHANRGNLVLSKTAKPGTPV